jgi:hypothetical protein
VPHQRARCGGANPEPREGRTRPPPPTTHQPTPPRRQPNGHPHPTPLTARAAAGAALLDQRWPGWHHQVDPGRLDLEDWRADILGQLYGTFGAGVHKLTVGLSEAEVDAWTVAHGFDVDDLDLRPSTGPVHAYLALTEAWQAELRRREGAGR